MSVYRFRDFQFDTVERRLTRNGEWVELTPKAMDILEVFVGRPGELITRDEMIGKVWAGTLVEEGNLSVHMSKLRKAFGETRSQRYVETVPGSGYRFTASIEQISNGANHSPALESIHTSSSNGFQSRDTEAIRLLRKGQFLFEKRTREAVAQSIEMYQKSLVYDASNVQTYAQLITSLRYLYLLDQITLEELQARTQPWLDAMCEIDPDSDAVLIALGEVALYHRWDGKSALRHFQAAVKINPTSLSARSRLIYLLIYSQCFPEAVEQLSFFANLEPFSIVTDLQMARFHYLMGNYQAAKMYLDGTLNLDRCNFEILLLRGVVLAELHLFHEAEANLRESLAIYDHVETIAMLGYVGARMNRRREAEDYIAKMVAKDAGLRLTFSYQARIQFALEDFDRGYDYLERAVALKSSELLGIAVDPRWNTVRHLPRFTSIVKQIGISVT